jgi:phosphoglycerate kinase
MTKLKTIKEVDVTNKPIILRVDFNCPVENGKVLDDYRIERALPTIEYLIEKGASKIVLISHFGRPKGEFKEEFSLKPVVGSFINKIKEVEGGVDLVEYKEDVEECINGIKESGTKIQFLENVRFWKEEEEGDEQFAKKLSEAGEIFVSDAFGACHRVHSSIVGIAKFLPACAGLLLEEEVSNIEKAIDDPAKPAVAVIGGAKLETKIPLIEKLAERYDQVLVGGLIAVELMADKALIEKFTKGENEGKVIIPAGFVDEEKRDINSETVELFKKYINEAKTILWNGPMGKFEEKPFDEGSVGVGNAIAESEAYKLTGGGETNEMLEAIGIFDKIDFISTGGGAMLELLAGEKLPGVEAVKE